MKNAIRYILILIILVIIFTILNFYKSKKDIFDDIMIFGLWSRNSIKNEYEINSQIYKKLNEEVSGIENRIYKKV